MPPFPTSTSAASITSIGARLSSNGHRQQQQLATTNVGSNTGHISYFLIPKNHKSPFSCEFSLTPKQPQQITSLSLSTATPPLSTSIGAVSITSTGARLSTRCRQQQQLAATDVGNNAGRIRQMRKLDI